MGASALNMINQITPLLLGLSGICGLIALVMALGRHFLYEHGNGDLQPVSKRITHVFGFLFAMGFIPVIGVNLAGKIAASSTPGQTGSSLVPADAARGNSYSNIGQLIMSQTHPNEGKGWLEGVLDGIGETLGAIGTAIVTGLSNADPTTQVRVDSAEEYKKAAESGDAYNMWLYGNNVNNMYIP